VCGRNTVTTVWTRSQIFITYLYFVRTVIHFFIRDVHGEFGLINVYLFDILPAICLENSRIFFCLESGNPVCPCRVVFERGSSGILPSVTFAFIISWQAGFKGS